MDCLQISFAQPWICESKSHLAGSRNPLQNPTSSLEQSVLIAPVFTRTECSLQTLIPPPSHCRFPLTICIVLWTYLSQLTGLSIENRVVIAKNPFLPDYIFSDPLRSQPYSFFLMLLSQNIFFTCVPTYLVTCCDVTLYCKYGDQFVFRQYSPCWPTLATMFIIRINRHSSSCIIGPSQFLCSSRLHFLIMHL